SESEKDVADRMRVFREYYKGPPNECCATCIERGSATPPKFATLWADAHLRDRFAQLCDALKKDASPYDQFVRFARAHIPEANGHCSWCFVRELWERVNAADLTQVEGRRTMFLTAFQKSVPRL